ncbi:MAG: bactofilin family protein [Solirubrobacterales bacterium]
MFGKSKAPNYDNIETIIAGLVVIKGEVKAAGSMRIDGEIDGSLDLKGNLVIGERGRVKGDIAVENVLVAGTVEGNILARGRTEITVTGSVVGDVEAGTFVVEEGGRFQGYCKMVERKPENQRPTEKPVMEKVAKKA